MKEINRFSKLITIIIALAVVLFACVDDDFDTPPVKQIPVGKVYTISDVKTLFTDSAINLNTGTGLAHLFDYDASIYATVTMDNETDNSYRTFFIQDQTGAIAVYQDVSGGVYIGDSVRIYLRNLVVMKYSNLYQLNSDIGDGVNVDSNLVKQETYNERTPELATIKQINDDSEYYQGRLVKITDIQFIDTDTAKTFADPETDPPTTVNTYIQDSLDNQIIVRTSGYANFAGFSVPDGSGSIIAIVGQYNSDMQLYIRKLSEVEMDNARFKVSSNGGSGDPSELLNETFDNDLGDFTQYSVTGDQVWTYDSYEYAKMTGYDGGRFDNEDWLISPELNLTGKSNVLLIFRHTAGYVYTGVWDELQLLVSKDYVGTGDPNSATWTAFTFDTPPEEPYWTWVDSGDIDLSAYDGESSVYFAFKYLSNTTNCSTWEIDNVVVSAE